MLFIRTTVADPLSLVTRILEGIRDSRKQVTRHLIRMLPVQATCKAYEENVKPTLQTLVDNFVADRPQGLDSFTKYQVKSKQSQQCFWVHFQRALLNCGARLCSSQNWGFAKKNILICLKIEVSEGAPHISRHACFTNCCQKKAFFWDRNTFAQKLRK